MVSYLFEARLLPPTLASSVIVVLLLSPFFVVTMITPFAPTWITCKTLCLSEDHRQPIWKEVDVGYSSQQLFIT